MALQSASANPHLKFAKGITQKTMDAREDRLEAAIKKTNRAWVHRRDGDCRLWKTDLFGGCMGKDEWNHLTKRSKTRNEPPEVRHATGITCMACTRHHTLIDKGVIKHRYLTKKKADGPMVWRQGSKRYDEREAA
jgi:hypothetical protein